MRIGPYQLGNSLVVAPMAGVTDRPFRALCKGFGAGLAVSEMVTSNALLHESAKTLRRIDHLDESPPIAVQIAGADPRLMAEAARINVDRGAQLIDINMGCPARKVCRVLAGSALLRDEPLVARILEAVVAAVRVPVTLKIRTGWDAAHKNAPRIARMAEESGIQALAIHGRTRACMFSGQAEYDTIAAVKASARIPIIANGDISSPEKARAVLAATRADGIMIGRAALGRPWIFREILHFLDTGERLPPPSPAEFRAVLLGHLDALHAFYGERVSVGIARKHIAWYTRGLPDSAAFRRRVFQLPTAALQRSAVEQFLSEREEAEREDSPAGTTAR
ncbi:MAG: tRNA dihydrouridine synthase DusB [Candidatus Methylomirabilota bacterium]